MCKENTEDCKDFSVAGRETGQRNSAKFAAGRDEIVQADLAGPLAVLESLKASGLRFSDHLV